MKYPLGKDGLCAFVSNAFQVLDYHRILDVPQDHVMLVEPFIFCGSFEEIKTPTTGREEFQEDAVPAGHMNGF